MGGSPVLPGQGIPARARADGQSGGGAGKTGQGLRRLGGLAGDTMWQQEEQPYHTRFRWDLHVLS